MKLPGDDTIARQADGHLVTYQVKLPQKVVQRPIRQVAKRLAVALPFWSAPRWRSSRNAPGRSGD